MLLGSFRRYPVATGIATTGVIFAAAYLLWALQRIIFNPLDQSGERGAAPTFPPRAGGAAPLVAGDDLDGPLSAAGAPAHRAGGPAIRRDGARPHLEPPARQPPEPGHDRPLDLRTPFGATMALLPEFALTGWALVVLLLVCLAARDRGRQPAGRLAQPRGPRAGGHRAGAAVDRWCPAGRAAPLMVALDDFRFAAPRSSWLVTAGDHPAFLGYLERQGSSRPEYYALVLFAAIGMMFLAGAEDLIVLFLGLEVMSVSVYVLAGFNRSAVLGRGGAQVLPHRRLRIGVPALWHRADLGATGATCWRSSGRRPAATSLPVDRQARARRCC